MSINYNLKMLLTEYSKGIIGFKKMCRLGNLTFAEGMLLIEQTGIEPPIPDSVDVYTNEVREKLSNGILLKDRQKFSRESPEVELEEQD